MRNKKNIIFFLIIIVLISIILFKLKLIKLSSGLYSRPTSGGDSLIGYNLNNIESKNSASSSESLLVDSKSNLINVTNITTNQLVRSPLNITGEARGFWFFEASFPVKIYDSNGQLLGSSIAQATSDWMTDKMVPFKTELKFNNPTTTAGVIIFEKDNPSGLAENEDQLKLPITFTPLLEKSVVKVYFLNDSKDPEFSCNKVFSVDREVIKTPAIARAALEELLKGVSVKESQKGYISSINSGVKIQSLSIINGVAKVDFSDQLEKKVGGSCRVLAIRSQIIETLKQFSTINNVVISINGRIDDILQP